MSQTGAFRQAGNNGRMALRLAALVVVMVGLSFAAVPLYRIFCAKTGWAGTPQRAAEAPTTIAPQTMTVRFDANTAPGLPWSFEAVQPALTVHIGESKLAFFRAVNRSKDTVTGSAVFNVSPDLMGQYFTKVQCFCFTEQTLKPGEAVEMPVSFFIDPANSERPRRQDSPRHDPVLHLPQSEEAASGRGRRPFVRSKSWLSTSSIMSITSSRRAPGPSWGR